MGKAGASLGERVMAKKQAILDALKDKLPDNFDELDPAEKKQIIEGLKAKVGASLGEGVMAKKQAILDALKDKLPDDFDELDEVAKKKIIEGLKAKSRCKSRRRGHG